MGAGVRPERDPDAELDALIASRRKALAALAAKPAAAAAADPDDAELDALIASRRAALGKPAGDESTPLQQWGAMIGEGATGGFASKAIGGIDALNHVAPTWMGGDGAPRSQFGPKYVGTRDQIRRAEAEGLRNHPVAGPATELVAGVATSLPLAAAAGARAAAGAVRATTLGQRVRVGAKAGAAYGAAAGAGRATGDVQDYATHMGVGAAGGAVVGAGVPVIGTAASKAAAALRAVPTGRTAQEMAADAALLRTPVGPEAGAATPKMASATEKVRVRTSAGASPAPTTGQRVRATFGRGAERVGVESSKTRALRELSRRLDDDNVAPADAVAFAERNARKPVAVLDLGGGNVAGLARTAKDIPGVGRRIIPGFLHGRSAGQGSTEGATLKRVVGDVEQRIGLKPENYYRAVDDMVADMKATAATNYGKIRDTVIDDPEVLGLFNEPEWRAIHTRIVANARLGGQEAIAPLTSVTNVGGQKVKALNPQTLGTLDKMKRQLDKVIAGKADALGPVDRDLAFNMRQRLNTILERMDELHPEYGQARAAYRGSAEGIDAYAQGQQEFMKLDPRAIQLQLSKMPERLRDLYRRGGYDALRTRLWKIEDGGNVGGFLEKNPDIRARVSALAKTADEAAALGDDVHVERTMGDRKNQILGGPNTAERLIEHQATTPRVTQFGNAVRNVPVIGKPLGWAVDNAATRGEIDQTSKTMGEAAKLLVKSGPEEVKALMEELLQLRAADAARSATRGQRVGAGTGSLIGAAYQREPRKR